MKGKQIRTSFDKNVQSCNVLAELDLQYFQPFMF